MAQPQLSGARELLLYMEDLDTPATYVFACGINSKSLNGTLNNTETPIQDCDDPTALPVRRVTANYFAEEVSGTGVLAREIFPDFEEVYKTGESHNWRVGIIGFGYWQGPFLMTARNVGGETEGFITLELTLASDGPVPFTAAPNFPTVP